jgi:hypothetical protein
MSRCVCHFKAGPRSRDAKFAFFISADHLCMVAMESASDNQEEIYWSVAVPLKSGIACMSSRRFNAVMRSSKAVFAMSSMSFGSGCSFNRTLRVGDGDC